MAGGSLLGKKVQHDRAVFEIAVFDSRIQSIPETADQAGAKLYALAQARNPFLLDQRFTQPDRQLEILALRRDRVLGKLDHLAVVGDFPLVLPGALRQFVVLRAGPL